MARWFFSFFFFPHFPWFYGLSIASGSPEMVLPGDWVVSSIWLLLSTGQLKLGPEVTHCQFVQGGYICCFCQVPVILPSSCNSGLSALPQKRWSNSVLSTALSPVRLAQWSTMALLWEVCLLPHPCSQPLLHFLPFLNEGSAPRSAPPPLLVLDYNLLFMLFSFVGGGVVQPAQGLCWIMFSRSG
jgi:hypothetical protein